MAIGNSLEPVGSMIGNSLSKLGQYKFILIGIVIVVSIAAIVYFISVARKKKAQWTHKFKVQRLLQNGSLTDVVIHKARRFPVIQGVEVFELEKPLLGSFLIPQPGEYSEVNTFSIILDSNNRIWNNKGYVFNKAQESVNVSAVHAGVDVEMHAMKDKWQQAHKVNKKITTLELIKAGLKVMMLIVITIIGIVAIGAWGDTQVVRAEKATQEAIAMEQLAQAIGVMQETVNTQQLQLIPMLKALYGKENIASEINKYCIETDEDQV